MNIIIINGPNLNLLGKREENIYGCREFDSFLIELKNIYGSFKIDYYQSNIEGEIINTLHENFQVDGIILNAGAYTHTSIGIADAVKAIKSPVVEVHISNIFAREEFRHISYIAPNCIGSVIGFGLNSYKLAVESLILHYQNKEID